LSRIANVGSLLSYIDIYEIQVARFKVFINNINIKLNMQLLLYQKLLLKCVGQNWWLIR